MLTSYLSSLIATEIPAAGLQGGEIDTQLPPNRLSLGSGTGLNQANKTYSENTTLVASGTKTIDVNVFGGAIDALGQAYALTTVKGIMIRNTSTDPTSNLTVAAGSSNGWAGINGATTGVKVAIRPGGEFVLMAPDATGFVVSSSNKTILLTNISSTAICTYQLQVLGAQ